jgi:sec-independent protein translocase protein TatA
MPFPNIGPGELILILIIALIVLGPGRLPDVASSLGKSVREFRKAASDVTEAARLDATPTTAQSTRAIPPSSMPTPSTDPAATTPTVAVPQPAEPATVTGEPVAAPGAAPEQGGHSNPA